MSSTMVAADTGERFARVHVPLWAWGALLVLLVLLLVVDLVRHSDAKAPTTKDAVIESAAWVACALTFAGVVWVTLGSQAFGEYLSGYLIEKSLSVDNVFVWALLFSTMAIPLKYQHRVLFWGIFGALTMRGVFIIAGAELIASFWWVLPGFGVFLVYTGVKVFRHRHDEGEAKTPGLKALQRILPVTETIEDRRFFTTLNGHRAATPLFAALVVIEISDVIFAVDSVPAILAVSRDPFVVFSSNAFAILGLRAMYFLLATAREKFHYLSHGLGAILVFVGLKMTVSHWLHIDTYLSLLVIVVLLGLAVVASVRKNRQP